MALVPAMVLGSIYLASRLPVPGYPGAWLGLGPVDFTRGPNGGVAPLRERFVADALGRSQRDPPARSPLLGAPFTSPSSGRGAIVPPSAVTHPLTNDNFSRAYRAPSVPFTARTNDAQAGRENGEPAACTPVGGTVWYRYVAPGDVGLVADTFGSDHAVTLGVFEGKNMRDLVLVECGTHARGNARVAFPAKAGTTYYFQVASISGGALEFNLRLQGITTRLSPRDEPLSVLATAFGGISPDGRFIVLSAITLVGGDAPVPDCVGFVGFAPPSPAGCRVEVFVIDRVTGARNLVSVNSRGEVANDVTLGVGISTDGRYVALSSIATNLVDDDTNQCGIYQVPGQCPDVFVHDRDADGNGVFDEVLPGALKTIRVSVSDQGVQGDGWSWVGLLSPDGRHLIIQSEASNLVPGDTNRVGDVFQYDRDADGNGIFDETFAGAHGIKRITLSSSGEQAKDEIDREFPVEHGHHLVGASVNGRYMVFRSAASNLVTSDTNGVYDVFVRDIVARTTTRVNVGPNGQEADRGSRLTNILSYKASDDGRYVAFNSPATNLIPNDTSGDDDLFVRDLVRRTTQLVTVDQDGRKAEGEPLTVGQDAVYGGVITAGVVVAFGLYTISELTHAITADGRYVFFSSGAKLVPEDENGQRDIYARDLWTQTTTLVSKSTKGVQGDSSSSAPIPSADGRLITFVSASTNLEDESAGPTDGLIYGSFLRFMPGGP